MCANDAEPEDIFFLKRGHLRVIAEPLRQRILELLSDREMSATELKGELEDAPSNLHYHVDKLREAGLIRLQRTAPRRGATEKYYRAVARCFTLAPELAQLTPQDRSLDQDMLATVRGFLERTYGGLAHSLRQGLLGEGKDAVVPVLNSCTFRASRERMAELRQQLIEWIEACQEARDPDGEVEYAALTMMFPVDPDDPR